MRGRRREEHQGQGLETKRAGSRLRHPQVCVCVTRTIFHGLPRAVDAVPGPPPVYPLPGTYPGGFGIDVAFEAGKLPLDVAIFNSARAAGGDEKIRKYLQAVLVVGGTALVPGMAHALESR